MFIVRCPIFGAHIFYFYSMDNTALFHAFVDAINAHDADMIATLVTEDHTFVDPHANTLSGRDMIREGWKGYFTWFPDYRVEIGHTMSEGDTVMAFGTAAASYKGTGAKEDGWKIPAAFRAKFVDGKLQVWQVVADTKLPFESVMRHES